MSRTFDPAAPANPWPIATPLWLGAASILVLLLSGLIWSLTATIGGAIRAPGLIAHQSGQMLVQHQVGGTVTDLLVAEGDEVVRGQILVQLDAAEVATEIALAQAEQQEIAARIGRLIAERDGLPEPVYDPQHAATTDASVRALLDGQRKLFSDQLAAFTRSSARIDTQRILALEQAERLRQQDLSLSEQIGLLEAELADQLTLLGRGLTERSRILSLKLELAAIAGQRAGLAAELARAEAAAGDAASELAQLADERRLQAQIELRDLEHMARGHAERLAALRLRFEQSRLRAQDDGIVQDFRISGPGAVLRPGEPAMALIPTGHRLIIIARIAASDLATVETGAEVTVQLIGPGRESHDDLAGRIRLVAADISQTADDSPPTYRAEIEILPSAAMPDGLRAGMPVLVLIPTNRQTPMQILVSPLSRYIARAV